MDTQLIDEIRKHREQIAEEEKYNFHALFSKIYLEQETHPTVNLKEGHERPTCTSTTQQVAEPQTPYGL
jgi:hypothetical protein